MEDGSLDLALVSDDMFSQDVLTVPAFKGKMVLAVSGLLEDSPRQPERMLSPSCLDPERKSACPGTRNMTHGTITGSAWG